MKRVDDASAHRPRHVDYRTAWTDAHACLTRDDGSADALLASIEHEDADGRFSPDWSDQSFENGRQVGELVVAQIEHVDTPTTPASATKTGLRLVAAQTLPTVA